MDHLGPRFRALHRRVGERRLGARDIVGRFRNADMAVAAGPVRTAQARVDQSRIGAEHHDHQGERNARHDKHKDGPGAVKHRQAPAGLGAAL